MSKTFSSYVVNLSQRQRIRIFVQNRPPHAAACGPLLTHRRRLHHVHCFILPRRNPARKQPQSIAGPRQPRVIILHRTVAGQRRLLAIRRSQNNIVVNNRRRPTLVRRYRRAYSPTPAPPSASPTCSRATRASSCRRWRHSGLVVRNNSKPPAGRADSTPHPPKPPATCPPPTPAAASPQNDPIHLRQIIRRRRQIHIRHDAASAPKLDFPHPLRNKRRQTILRHRRPRTLHTPIRRQIALPRRIAHREPHRLVLLHILNRIKRQPLRRIVRPRLLGQRRRQFAMIKRRLPRRVASVTTSTNSFAPPFKSLRYQNRVLFANQWASIRCL